MWGTTQTASKLRDMKGCLRTWPQLSSASVQWDTCRDCTSATDCLASQAVYKQLKVWKILEYSLRSNVWLFIIC